MDLALDDNLDIVWPTRIVTGRELTMQRLRVRLSTHRGEWALDTAQGVPYAQWDEELTPTDDIRDTIVIEVLDTPGIASFNDVVVEQDVVGVLRVSGTVTFNDADPAAAQLLVDLTPVQGALAVRLI